MVEALTALSAGATITDVATQIRRDLGTSDVDTELLGRLLSLVR